MHTVDRLRILLAALRQTERCVEEGIRDSWTDALAHLRSNRHIHQWALAELRALSGGDDGARGLSGMLRWTLGSALLRRTSNDRSPLRRLGLRLFRPVFGLCASTLTEALASLAEVTPGEARAAREAMVDRRVRLSIARSALQDALDLERDPHRQVVMGICSSIPDPRATTYAQLFALAGETEPAA